MTAHLRSIGTWTALAILCSAPGFGLKAQSSAAIAGNAKIAVINVQAAMAATAEGKQAEAEMQSKFAPRENELQEIQKQIDDIQRRLAEGTRTLSADEKTRLQNNGQLLSRHLQRATDDVNDDVQAAESAVFDNIGPKIIQLLSGYSRDNGYAVVLDASTQDRVVLYGAPELDITQDIVRLYDRTYPVKTASEPGVGAPSLPKPVTPAKKTTP
jgi:outer membrane protein